MSTAAAPTNAPMRPWQATLARHPLIAFFSLAYGGSWLVSAPYLLFVWGLAPAPLMPGFMAKQWAGPALAALMMSWVLGGRAAVRDLRARGRQWRLGWKTYLVVLGGTPLLVLLGVLVSGGVATPAVAPGMQLVGASVGYFLLVFLAVGLPEELGWRGFALPRLQARFGPLRGTVLLGVLWAGWHLPFFLAPDHGGGPGTDPRSVAVNFVVFAGLVLALAITFTYLYNRTGGNVLATALLHTAIDTPQVVWLPLLLPVGAENSTSGEWRLDLGLLAVFGILALGIVAGTRGRLGYAAGARPPAPPLARSGHRTA